MGMVRHRVLSSSWLNVEARACSGFLFLSLLWCALVFSWLNYVYVKASREGRRRLRRALLLLPPLLLFSSLSFASSSISGNTDVSNGSCTSCSTACISLGGTEYPGSLNGSNCACEGSSGAVFAPSLCTQSCTPSSGEPIGEIGTSLTPNSNGVVSGTYCSPSTFCDTYSFSSSAGTGGDMTNGNACFPTSPTSSTSSSSSDCPAGYSVSDSSGCICSNGSGSFVDSNNSDTNPNCNGGSPTAPVLSPVSPVTSGGVTSCPSGSASVSSGGSISCYQPVVPPAVNPLATPGGSSGGSGGGSSFHLAAPTKSSNGQLTCPPGASSIGSGSSLECIVSGPGGSGSSTSPTSSGSSGTSPTGSTGSSSFPNSFSMPSMATVSVVVSPLSSVAAAHELTSQVCPQPVTFDVLNHSFSITFTYACQLAAKVRPVIIGVFSMASLLLIVK